MLSELEGPVAEFYLNEHEKVLFSALDGPIRGGLADDDLRQFKASCQHRLRQAREDLLRSVEHTDMLACAHLAILVGQIDPQSGLVSPSPNAFSFELEQIANYATIRRRRRFFDSARFRHALNALRHARRINVLSQLTIGPDGAIERYEDRPNSLADLLRIDWLGVRGRFFAPFDQEFVNGLSAKLQDRCLDVPVPQVLQKLVRAFVSRWAYTIDRFYHNLETTSSPLLEHAFSTQTLLNTKKELLPVECRLLSKYSSLLEMTEAELLQVAGSEASQSISRWLRDLSLNVGLDERLEVAAYSGSPLQAAPILVDRGRYTLALPHRLSTDVSTTVHERWSKSFGEKYFEARAQQVEGMSLSALVDLVPSASHIGQARYSSRDRSTHGEVDGVVAWRDVLFIVEGKGGYLSIPARRGSQEAAESDLRDTVGDGYFQALRLLKLLQVEDSINLEGADRSRLTLEAKNIRRTYVIIPTADDLGAVAMNLEELWRVGILPNRSCPLVISVQDFALLLLVLRSAQDLISYLDYRAEILIDRHIQMADELETLGAYVGGLDMVGHVQEKFRERPNYMQQVAQQGLTLKMPFVANLQEAYLDPWFAAHFGRSGTAVTPPSRHSARVSTELERMWEKHGDLDAYCAAAGVHHKALEEALDMDLRPRRRSVNYRFNGQTAIIFFAPPMRLAEARRHANVRKLREESRQLVFLWCSTTGTSIRHAELGARHYLFRRASRDSTRLSDLRDTDNWYESFRSRRSKRYSASVVGSLEALGLHRDMAVGVDRAGLRDLVLETVGNDGDLSKCAAIWLGPITTLANEAKVSPDTLGITPGDVRVVLRMVDEGTLPNGNVKELLEARLADNGQDLHRLAVMEDLVILKDRVLIERVVTQVLEREPEAVAKARTGNKRVLNYLLGEVQRELDSKADVSLTLDIITKSIS